MNNNNTKIREQFNKYLSHWKWFIMGIIICLLLSFTYLRYKNPLYEIHATVLVKDSEKGGVMTERSAFQDMGVFRGLKNNVNNELEVLKSRLLTKKVVKDLKLNIKYYEPKKLFENSIANWIFGRAIFKKELYGEDRFLKLNFIQSDSLISKLDTTFAVKIKSSTNYELKNSEGKTVQESAFGKSVNTKLGTIIVIPIKPITKKQIGKEYYISIQPIDMVIDEYRSNISINTISETSSIIKINMLTPIKKKGKDIINDLLNNYLDKKTDLERKVSEFINQRLQVVTDELSIVSKSAVDFKKSKQISDSRSQSDLYLQSVSDNERKAMETSTQLRLVEYIEEYLSTHNNTSDLIPTNLSFSDQPLKESTNKYNSLVLERNRILKNSSIKNPIILNLDSQIRSIRKNLIESLKNLKATLNITLNELKRRGSRINYRISKVPSNQQELKNIQRRQNLIEQVYLYLSKKREEIDISLGVKQDSSTIVDGAFSSVLPVSPKKSIIILAALLLGVFLPAGAIYLADILDTKVHDRKDLENRLKIPILGDIPAFSYNGQRIKSYDDRSGYAESFKLLCTNIEFMLANSPKKGRTVFVTSTVSQEGKSTVSVNLASTLAFSGKKVLLIGLDLRVPKITNYIGLKMKKGVTSFVKDENMEFKELLLEAPYVKNLHVISSGFIPPNPTMILQHKRITELFEIAKKQYDYVIVDTSAVSLVTDTLLLSHFADLSIYVVKAGKLDKQQLDVVEMMYNEKRLPNIALLLNGVYHKSGFGYGYGYMDKSKRNIFSLNFWHNT